MGKSIEKYIVVVKRLKQTYGNQHFKKPGLHAVLNDLSPSLDKKFLNVLKKADDFLLFLKIDNLEPENESIKTIDLAKYRQDFLENSGLDNQLATLIYDTYLFGFDIKENLKLEDYKAESNKPNLFLDELIDMALVDNKLERSEIENIFNKCQKQGLPEDDIFKQLVKTINQYNLQPLTALAEVKLRDKSTLLQYDWVNKDVLKQKELQQASISNNPEQEKLANQEQSKGLIEELGGDGSIKEYALKKTELESKIKEEGAKEKTIAQKTLNKINDEKQTREILKSTKTIKIKRGGFFSSKHVEITSKNCTLSTFNNGDVIPEVTSFGEMRSVMENKSPAWCWYDFDETNQEFGKLYNIYAVKDKRGLAPDGFKIPSKADWQELIDIVGLEGSKYLSREVVITGKSGQKFKGRDTFGLNMKLSGVLRACKFFNEREEVIFYASSASNDMCFGISLKQKGEGAAGNRRYFFNCAPHVFEDESMREHTYWAFVRFLRIK